ERRAVARSRLRGQQRDVPRAVSFFSPPTSDKLSASKPMDIYAVILAGGGGTRLWPASRRRRPKQFVALAPGGRSLLAATVDRVATELEHVLVVTAAPQVAEVRAALPRLPFENVIAEPVARNTAPAIALAAHELARRGHGEAVMAVLPSGHVGAGGGAVRQVVGPAGTTAPEHLRTRG